MQLKDKANKWLFSIFIAKRIMRNLFFECVITLKDHTLRMVTQLFANVLPYCPEVGHCRRKWPEINLKRKVNQLEVESKTNRRLVTLILTGKVQKGYPEDSYAPEAGAAGFWIF
ncbi:MAG: hypothetical protein JWP37_2259 [Mucilaginibacter sp.]|nr:hypothetical protein [Mucilaginibacter sp.]